MWQDKKSYDKSIGLIWPLSYDGKSCVLATRWHYSATTLTKDNLILFSAPASLYQSSNPLVLMESAHTLGFEIHTNMVGSQMFDVFCEMFHINIYPTIVCKP